VNKKWTEKEIQLILLLHLPSRKYNIPNFQPFGWYEADILSITQSDYIYEYEIKTSSTDFCADFTNKRYKHMLLEGKLKPSYHNIPRKFFFVCPDGLIDISRIPQYAGLVYVCVSEYGNQRLKIIKDAPTNKSATKISTKDKERIFVSLYWRYIRLWREKYA